MDKKVDEVGEAGDDEELIQDLIQDTFFNSDGEFRQDFAKYFDKEGGKEYGESPIQKSPKCSRISEKAKQEDRMLMTCVSSRSRLTSRSMHTRVACKSVLVAWVSCAPQM